ncbi:MAG: DinB family protein [Anaerolineales bacterium]|nr:DinB family protein [Anaerolineales bacterium]
MNSKSKRSKRQNIVLPGLSDVPEIGRWLWALQDTRERTFEELEGLSDEVLNWQPSPKESSIGALLYHIAYIEADWLFIEVLERPIPQEVEAQFGQGVRDDNGQLVQVGEQSLQANLNRLSQIRERLITVFQEMSLEEFRRPRSFEYYDVTPEWVLHHLMQHEAEHRSQIGAMRAKAGTETSRF